MNAKELKHMARLREWTEKVAACRSSGQSVRAWCREQEIAVKTYYYWEKEILSKETDFCWYTSGWRRGVSRGRGTGVGKGDHGAAVPLTHGGAERGAAESEPHSGGIKTGINCGKALKTPAFWSALWYNKTMKKLQETGTRATETVTLSRGEYDALMAERTELKSQNEWLLEQLRLANKKRFGASSEKVREELMG